MTREPERRTFYTLDGLRAVGAFLVVMRHVPFLFGPIAVPESFLAVDLFYLVSGFVVAHAYRDRLAAGGFVWTFVKTRIIRLYPLYLFGLGLGLDGAPGRRFTSACSAGCSVAGAAAAGQWGGGASERTLTYARSDSQSSGPKSRVGAST